MKRYLLLLLLIAAPVSAQTVPAVTQPTNTWSMDWDYAPTATQVPLSAVNHFEVQWTATGPWSNAGKQLTIPLPGLAVGTYAGRVRACRTADSSDCVVSVASLPFTVVSQTPPPPPPPPTAMAAPSGLRLVRAGTVVTGTTYFETNFSAGLPAYMRLNQYGNGSCASSTQFKDAGSAASWRCAIVNDGAAAVETVFPRASQVADKPKDPALDRDFYFQYRFVIGAGSGTVQRGSNQDDYQWKFHKSTYGEMGSNVNGWSMMTMKVGGDGLITEPELWNNDFSPDPPFTANTAYPNFIEGVVYELVRYYRRDSARQCGYYGLWVNGQRRIKTGCMPWLGTTGGSSEGLTLQDGATYAQNMIGTVTIYSLYMRATNFPIGGVVF